MIVDIFKNVTRKDNQSYEKYDNLKVLILTKKKSYTTTFDTDGKFLFDVKNDVIDVEDIIKHIRGLDTEAIKEINNYLERELSTKICAEHRTQASEVDTIIDLIEFISKHKAVNKKLDVTIDPDYKIYKRFREFADQLVGEYTALYMIYGNSLSTVEDILGTDEAQDTLVQCLNYLSNQEEKYQDFQYILTLNRDKIENEERTKSINMDIDAHTVAKFTKQSKFFKRDYQER